MIFAPRAGCVARTSGHDGGAPVRSTLLLSGSGGYGFMAPVEGMVSKCKAGKSFVTVNEGETLCAPSLVAGAF